MGIFILSSCAAIYCRVVSVTTWISKRCDSNSHFFQLSMLSTCLGGHSIPALTKSTGIWGVSFVFLLMQLSLSCPHKRPPLSLPLQPQFLWHSAGGCYVVVSVPANYLRWCFHGRRCGWHCALRCGRRAVQRCRRLTDGDAGLWNILNRDGKEPEHGSERSLNALRLVSIQAQPSLVLSEHKCLLFINFQCLSSSLI